MKKAFAVLTVFAMVLHGPAGFARGSEVFEETPTKVAVRNHPKTGKAYVSIVDEGLAVERVPLTDRELDPERPDYRMLDPKIKAGEIPYHGPVSDRKKVYLLAAGLATAGTVSSFAAAAAIPAAASSGASAAGGAGAYAAAGTAVTAGTVSTVWLKTQPDPDGDDYQRRSESSVLEGPGSADSAERKD